MARYLGVGSVFKSPRTTRTYTVAAAAQWDGVSQPLRPPAHIIGVGGFGATYRVEDERGAAFAMKEYFPRDHAARGADGRITPRRDEEGFSRKIYEEGLRRFVAEGQLLTSFNHPNVLKMVDAFDDNGTSYQLMRLVEGREQLGESDTGAARIERRVTFEDFLRELEGGAVPIDVPLIRPVIKQLLDAVEYIHTEGSRKAQEITGTATRVLLHRDIKPSNILIEAPAALREAGAEEILRHPDTKAILIDFGSARIFRDVQEDDVSRSIGVVTEGYAPPELKDNDVDSQGPHSDIYSIAAVIWRALMGRKPTTAQLANGAKIAELATPLTLPDGTTKPRASKPFLQAVDRALSAAVSQRPHSVAEWRTELSGQAAPARREAKRAAAKTKDGGQKNKGATAFWMVAMTVAMIAVSGYTFWQREAGGPTRAIEREADAATKDADGAAKIADDNKTKVDQLASTGPTFIGDAMAKAQEGRDKYARFAAAASASITHGPDEGSETLGEKSGAATRPDGSRVHVWCFKPQPSISYESGRADGFYNVPMDGDPGWVCGVPHVHMLGGEFNEPKNPWHIEGKDFTYDGEVNDQLQPQGLGVLSIDTHQFLDIFGGDYVGRFETKGSTVTLVGMRGKASSGQFQFAWGAPPKLTGSVTGIHIANLEDVEADLAGERSVMVDTDTKGNASRGLLWKDGFVGVRRQSDGTALKVSGPRGRAWGRLEQGDAVYRGQLIDTKPDGCGVWTWRDGSKETGFYVAGKKKDGDLPDECKNPHYIRPVDLGAVARDGAQALPQ